MNWENELINLFEDPLLADVRPLAPLVTSDDRLSESFLELTTWVEDKGREPLDNSEEFNERILFRRLKNLRADDEKRLYLMPLDRLGLL
ncbi:MAG TPA: hypothetical protein VJY12_10560 [Dysgonamonadaceae bacterium]|nr:hypothetical protein [Dysgonamonadaceae bacterium]